jgi:Fur family zinc uptake transcriptional regulator
VDTDPSLEAQLDRAAAACAARGAQLTELRRQVLGLVIAAGQPVGAYALLDRLRPLREGAAPPTVYRALDFLLEQGLIHRIERLNAFVACEACGAAPREPHHVAQFLICRDCGATREIADPQIGAALAEAAAGAQFFPGRSTIEVEGRCARCAARG